ncbi:MAG: CDGSH iron-sulfur domain-containing protein [Limisphaerales bacterium]
MIKPLIAQKSPVIQCVVAGVYWWYACGRSATQPFCDGSHGDSGFSPERVEIDSDRKAAWCACKHTGTPPFCDGQHRNLP